MVGPIVAILVSVVIAAAILTVLMFAASPIVAIGSVVINKIDKLSSRQRWIAYWSEWEMRHRD